MIRKLSAWSLFAVAVVVCLLMAGCSRRSSQPAAVSSTASHDHAIGDDFALTSHDGGRFQLSQQRGKIVLLFFGYTSCPDACPTMMAKLQNVYEKLGGKKDRVQIVFVSVDPQHDTPQELKAYLRYFKIGAIGLTGTREEIDAVVKQYGASYEIEKSDSALGYHINHSTYLYLIDQSGKVANQFKHTDDANAIVGGINKLIQ